MGKGKRVGMAAFPPQCARQMEAVLADAHSVVRPSACLLSLGLDNAGGETMARLVEMRILSYLSIIRWHAKSCNDVVVGRAL